MKIDEKRFRECSTSEDYFIGRCVYKPLSNLFARILLHTPITPNQLTIFWGLLMIAASIAFVFNNYVISIIAGVCWVLAYSMDGTDGTIARYKNIKSYRGKYYDLINHRTTYPLLMFCIGLGMWQFGRTEFFGITFDPMIYIITGFLAGMGMWMIMDLRKCRDSAYPYDSPDNDEYDTQCIEAKNVSRKTFLIVMSLNPLSFINMMFLLPIFAALKALDIFILFYGFTYPVFAFIRYIILARDIPPRIAS